LSTVIKVEGVGKQYRLGMVGTGTLSHDLNRAWHRIRGKEDPYLQVGDVNDRSEIGESDLVWALQDIDFEVKQGEVIGIIGKNGAGKSTLLKILSQVTTPTTGEIKVKGRIASLLEVGTGFHPELTGRENIFLNGAILGMTKAEIKSKLDEIIDFSGVQKYVDTPVKRYSSGMMVRMGFAVAAHLDPEILIVDEVLAVGDAEFQKKCIEKMRSISNEGRTILFVSHNLGIINSFCPKTLLLANGKKIGFGNTDKMISNYLNVGGTELVKKLVDEERVRGNGKVKILECAIYSNLGNLKNEFSIGENFFLKFLITSNLQGNVGFWLIIRDSQGNPILCSHQKDKSKLSIEKGQFYIKYETKNISLLPGSYIITAGILDYEYTEFYEWIDNCQSFEILPAFQNGLKYDNRLGYAQQEADWSIQNV
jgi:lipopolysaccharide transport system ATP-binding protein